MKIFSLIYDVLFIAGFVFYLPFYFLKKKVNFTSLKCRLGIFSFFSKNSIWVHAVSVGEVILIEPLLKKLQDLFQLPIVVSVTTLTGYGVALEKYSAKGIKVIYSPLDLTFTIKRFLKKINPKLFIAAETELWPNLILCLKQKNIPFLVVNGRISKPAFRRYCFLKIVFKKILSGPVYIGAQTEADKQRFLALGAVESQVSITGNLKFNIAGLVPQKNKSQAQKYASFLKPEKVFLFTAASTHSPEEKIVIAIYQNIYKKYPLNLLIAPRHPQRVNSVEKLIKDKGFNPVRISQISFFPEAALKKLFQAENVFILDTVGQLFYFYDFSDICFVGGSFSNSGGHNILEPISLLKPTLFGPSMENFAAIKETVLKYSAGIEVKSPAQLQEKIVFLLENEKARVSYSRACKLVFEKEDSLEKTIRFIKEKISGK